MVLDTSIADSKIKIRDELKKLEKDKSFKRTELPADKVENNSSKNPFLDVSVRELVDDFLEMIKKNPELKSKILAEDEKTKLMSLSGVKKYPMRVKCATMAWHTLTSAMQNSNKEKSD